MDNKVCMVPKVMKDQGDSKDHWGQLDYKECQDHQVPRETLETWVHWYVAYCTMLCLLNKFQVTCLLL